MNRAKKEKEAFLASYGCVTLPCDTRNKASFIAISSIAVLMMMLIYRLHNIVFTAFKHDANIAAVLFTPQIRFLKTLPVYS